MEMLYKNIILHHFLISVEMQNIYELDIFRFSKALEHHLQVDI